MSAIKTSQEWWYVLISLKLYWSQVAESQGVEPVYTLRGYDNNSLFITATNRVVDMIAQLTNDKRLGSVDAVACSTWDMRDIVHAFSDWGITHDMLDVERPFGAVATRTLWVVYINKYILPLYASTDSVITLSGFDVSLSPWLSCLYILGSNGQGRLRWEKMQA